MALEQKLHLKLSQKLIMTPSLQQAIKLLQLSKLELQEVLNQELLENPLLEESAEEAKQEEAEVEAQEKTQTEEEAKAAEPPKKEEKDSYDEIDYDAYFEDVQKAISVIQALDPIGVGARDLRECLLLQLEFLEIDTPLVDTIIRDHWEMFMQRHFVQLAKVLGIDMKTLEGIVELIKHLDPKPGRKYSNERAIYVEPDVYVQKVGDEYVIVLNEDGMPKLRINGSYRAMLNSMDSKQDGETVNYIKDKIRSAVWLIKSLDQRQRTIYKVAESIVKHQREFLEKGIDYLRPLVLRDVADDIQMHESTVSRVVSNKYMHTPRGLFLMKYFFHSGIDSDTGEDISSLTVKKKIQSYIEGEDPRKPLSDSKIMKILNDEGINIARRTVAKYRDELNIPSSTDRKQIF